VAAADPSIWVGTGIVVESRWRLCPRGARSELRLKVATATVVATCARVKEGRLGPQTAGDLWGCHRATFTTMSSTRHAPVMIKMRMRVGVDMGWLLGRYRHGTDEAEHKG